MNMDISDVKKLAAGLSTALTPLTNHSGCLELLARANGLQNWQTYRAQLARTWCYRQHEPFLPNELHVVKSLSVRKAVWRDVTEQADTDELLAQSIASIRRMFWQINLVRHGALSVEFELKLALDTATSHTLEALRQHLYGAQRNVEDFLSDFGSKAMSVTNAERYQNLYVTWRLASLSHALGKLMHRSGSSQLLALMDSHVDPYSFLALNLLGPLQPNAPLPSDSGLAEMAEKLRIQNPCARYGAKAVLLEYMTGSDVRFAALNSTLHLPQWNLELEDAYAVVEEVFPELAVWHAWVELKPLLAADADAVYKERSR